ncbi:MAG: hypothetical protein VKL59_07800 [Nostocaceae cyanobacterium]|nr:hypothetical protein [Nostocaceae cyanobacterium]
MEILGATRFDQCVINISLINICNQQSYVGQEMRKLYNSWKEETDEAINNPWLDLQQFTIYVPHPDQKYENITLEEGLTRGYNVEVNPVEDRTQVPYDIPEGGHFVVIFKQKSIDSDFKIAATGIFIRPLAILSLDIIVDLEKAEYQPLVIKHPVIRDYPEGWEQKLAMFINREIRFEELPNIVAYVDQSLNQDYRPPSWNEVYLSATGFAGF